jgi:Protein of unknown function (DUF2845)
MKQERTLLMRTLMSSIQKLLIPVTAMLLMSGPALAMRCGHDLVSIGDRTAEVLEKCGEPLSIDRWELLRQSSGFFHFQTWEQVVVEEWTYNLGAHSFLRVLRFENGRLVHEETAGRGFD